MSEVIDVDGAVDVHAAKIKTFKIQDMAFHQVTLLFACIVLAALAGILISLAVEAMPVFRQFGVSFLWTNVWNVPEELFGALSAIYGTVVTSIIALTIAVPVSFGIALFLTETCPAWLQIGRASCRERVS
jgi:phosphate transport system permease protein